MAGPHGRSSENPRLPDRTGEVEAVLRQIDGVREAAVIARTEGEETELCAYIEGQDQQTVRTELRKRLPAYMMPSAFIEMREWPVTPSGKLDRKALPAPTERLNDALTPRRKPSRK